jgi:hypothetical protein
MSSDIATMPSVTSVELSGKLENGDIITQVFPVQHPSGEADSIIIARAFAMLKNSGGLLVDTEGGGMDFYLGSKFVGPIHFEIKKVSLAGMDALAGLKRGPQLVQ